LLLKSRVLLSLFFLKPLPLFLSLLPFNFLQPLLLLQLQPILPLFIRLDALKPLPLLIVLLLSDPRPFAFLFLFHISLVRRLQLFNLVQKLLHFILTLILVQLVKIHLCALRVLRQHPVISFLPLIEDRHQTLFRLNPRPINQLLNLMRTLPDFLYPVIELAHNLQLALLQNLQIFFLFDSQHFLLLAACINGLLQNPFLPV
jgi:hypothetical protein